MNMKLSYSVVVFIISKLLMVGAIPNISNIVSYDFELGLRQDKDVLAYNRTFTYPNQQIEAGQKTYFPYVVPSFNDRTITYMRLIQRGTSTLKQDVRRFIGGPGRSYIILLLGEIPQEPVSFQIEIYAIKKIYYENSKNTLIGIVENSENDLYENLFDLALSQVSNDASYSTTKASFFLGFLFFAILMYF